MIFKSFQQLSFACASFPAIPINPAAPDVETKEHGWRVVTPKIRWPWGYVGFRPGASSVGGLVPTENKNLTSPAATLGFTIAALVLVFEAGCGIPHLRQPDNVATLPSGFSNPVRQTEETPESVPENSAKLGFEDFFQDPVLTQLISTALANNLELRVLNEEIQIAKNEVLARQGTYLPFVTIGGGGSLDKPSLYTRDGAIDNELSILPGRPIPDPLWNTALGLGFIWQLDIWRQLRNARDAAIQRYVGAQEKRNYQVTRLVSETAELYYKLMALDKRIENLDMTIRLQERSLEFSKAMKDAGRGTELPVQRFLAEVSRNQSQKLIVRQDIIEAENRLNFLLNRYPEPIERSSERFFDITIQTIAAGVPSELLENRPDIRQAARELEAAGLDIKVARARFFPTLMINASAGYQAFNPRYLLNTPEAIAAGVAGDLVAPLINKKAIKADYMSANARQLQAVYNYQKAILNAYTEVVNKLSMVDNYSKSIEIKKQQLQALETSVQVASRLFQNARAEYIDVLFAQRDLQEARLDLIEAKNSQLKGIVTAYQSLGGGNALAWEPLDLPGRHR